MTELVVKEELICRVCLSSQEEKYMSLFEKYKYFCIFEYINILSNVNIQKSDGFPDKICKSCFFHLETALNFKEKCEDADVKLKLQNVKTSPTANSHTLREIKPVKIDKVMKLENELEEDYCDTFIYECALSQDEIINDVEVIPNFNDLSSKENIKLQVQCHDCGGLFTSKCKLRVHWKKIHLPSALFCSRCKKTFKSYKTMHVHFKKNNFSCGIASDKNVRIEGEGRSRIFHCKECSYSTSRIRDMAAHLRRHSGEKPYQCSECLKRFSQQSSLISHKEAMHKNFLLEITCQFCGKVMKGRSRMARHLKTHYDERIKCEICKKPVFQRYLNDHMLRHTGTKTITCEICAAPFYTTSELYNHKRNKHIKGELKKCTKCDFKVAKTDVLKRHISKHTDDNFPCTICGKFFPATKRLQTHLKGHFEKKQYHCLICDKDFLYKDSLRRHKLEKHKNYIESELNTVVK